MISVVAVLVLLALVVTPFMLTQRDAASRGERYLYNADANAEAETLFGLVRNEMIRSLEHVEYEKLQALSSAASADSESRPPSDATPSSDTLSEFALSDATLARFNRASARQHRVWDVKVVDQQSLVDLNDCSVPILANILGRSYLSDVVSPEADMIPLDDGSVFNAEGGIVRLGNEVIKYKSVQGNTLMGCERGYKSGMPMNGDAQAWEEGDAVVHEAAVQLALRPFMAEKGRFIRYTNIYQARSIADMGLVSLSADEFDLLRRYATVWSGNLIGESWSNPQTLERSIQAGDAGVISVDIKNLRYFGPGTVVRITDGVNDDYAIVGKVIGNQTVYLIGDVSHSYDTDNSRIYCLARSPVNINTATEDMLTMIFSGVQLRGRGAPIDANKARALAAYLRSWNNPEDDDEDAELGVFRSWRDFVACIDQAQSEDNVLSADEAEAITRNAMNANDQFLKFSTVPFVFRSFDIYEAHATASILGQDGRELARRSMRRTFRAGTSVSGRLIVESQDDFQRQIIKSRNSKWWCSYPENIMGQYDGINIPASEYRPFRQKNRFPSTARTAAEGDMRLLPIRVNFATRRDRYIHFDGSDDPDGEVLESDPLTFSVDGPYAIEKRQLDLVDFVTIDGRGDDVQVGLKPFATSFWYRPNWERGQGDQIIFDYGHNSPTMNRVVLRYNDEADKLELSVMDATREGRGYSVFYDFADHVWEAETWYHIAVSVQGCGPGLSELFVDAEKVGESNGITRITQTISESVTAPFQLSVENAELFPERGVLFLNGTEGAELMEYEGHTDSAFNITRRKARAIDVVDADDQRRTHQDGAVVELYGFAAPLYTDLRSGGGLLQNDVRPWRVYRLIATAHDTFVPPGSTGPTWTGLGGNPGDLNFVVEDLLLEDWDTGSNDSQILDDLGPAGSEGIAMIVVGPSRTIDIGAPATLAGTHAGSMIDQVIGASCEFVRYRVGSTAGEVDLIQRQVGLIHHQSTFGDSGNFRFFPTYDYGDAASPMPGTSGDSNPGFATAFIPISVQFQGSNASYLNPVDEETQLGGLDSRFAFIQIDSEWIAYDTLDSTTVSGTTLFYRDMRMDELANVFGAAGTLDFIEPSESPSSTAPGGAGQTGSDTEPPVATDDNVEQDLPDEATSGSGTTGQLPEPPYTSAEIAAALDFRGYIKQSDDQDFRIANTIPRDHASGANIMPTFLTVPGNDFEPEAGGENAVRDALPGFNDLLTLRDVDGADTQVRVQWGYRGWVGLTAVTENDWGWDRPDDLVNRSFPLRRFDSRAWTRVLKYPSSELPDISLTEGSDEFNFGLQYDGESGISQCTIDEMTFYDFDTAPDDRPNWVYLGEVPSEIVQLILNPSGNNTPDSEFEAVFEGIDEEQDSFKVHLTWYDTDTQTFTASGLGIDEGHFPPDGGIIQIDDELIFYDELDLETGEFTGCTRGVFGTEAASHTYNARVVAVHCFPASRLLNDVDETSAAYELEDSTDFPENGYLRIADGREVIGYTFRDGNNLQGPLGRIDPEASEGSKSTSEEKAEIGGALFRGRFGTVAETYSAGDLVILMPARYHDRYAEQADHPELAFVGLAWSKQGAIWKRLSWRQTPIANAEIIALMRFTGGPPWDSQNIIHLGEKPIPDGDRRGNLYLIRQGRKNDLNLMNIEADQWEVRFFVRFDQGAFVRAYDLGGSDQLSNSWKETPYLKRVVVEYVAPPTVLTQE